MHVDAQDIEPGPLAWGRSNLPNVRTWYPRPLDTIDYNWDIITCSHVIEHISDPMPLIYTILERCRWAIFYAPYEEVDPLPYHNFVVHGPWVTALRPKYMETMNSLGWRRKWSVPDLWRTVLFVLEGKVQP